MTTFVNFAELAVQYGYATLFAAAFPLSPIMAMLNNYIKIRYAMLSSTTSDLLVLAPPLSSRHQPLCIHLLVSTAVHSLTHLPPCVLPSGWTCGACA